MGVSTVLYSAMADPDLQIKGLGGGGAVSKNVFSALRASFWSNNKRGGGGSGPPGPLPCIRHCREKAYACIVKWEGVCIQPECVRL